MLFQSVLTLAVLAGSAAAQTNATFLDGGNTGLDQTKTASWCIGQRSVCDTLCSKATTKNDCKSSDLTWNCVCSSGTTPDDVADYMNTIPYYICEESYARCISAHPDDALGQTECNDNIRDECGSKDIANFTAATTTSTSTSSAAASTTAEASTTESESAATTTAAAAAATTTKADSGASALKGSVVLVAGILAAFGFML